MYYGDDLEQTATFLEQHGIHKVKLAGMDLDGVLRGKYVSLDKLRSAAAHGFGFCDVIFGWDTQDACYDFSSVTGWHAGFPDTLTKIAPRTIRMVPWEPGTAAFLCDFWRDEETPHPAGPRTLLKRAIARAEAMGYRPKASIEYEFWIFRETPQSLHDKGFRNLTNLSPGSFGYSVLRASENGRLVHDLFDACQGFSIGLEGLHTETGPGVYEAAIGVQDALEAADRAALFKTTAKEICGRYECTATFMARWSDQHAGSGGHVHQSLWSLVDEEGGEESRNLFATTSDSSEQPDITRHYLGGQLALMPELTALFCPTVNSYKRLIPGYWAPTRATWGVENRTCSLRTIPSLGGGKAARIEHRLPGADANPYLALAASLASGLWGIENKSDPGQPVQGSAYDSDAPHLPNTLEAATERFRNSEVARELFGDEFVEHYALTRDWEVRQQRQAVTDWELRRYFEII